MPSTSACVSRSATGASRQARSVAWAAALPLHRVGDLEQPLGGVGAAVEHHVLDPLEQIGRDVVVDRERAGVHDPHVHAGLDGVVEEDRVDRLAHRVVAAEREGDVAHAAAHEHVRAAPP